MSLSFESISTGGASGGSIGDTWHAIGGGAKTIAVYPGSSAGTHYTVPEGKRFVGYIQSWQSSIEINGTSFPQNFWNISQNYQTRTLVRLTAGDVISTPGGYAAILGIESAA